MPRLPIFFAPLQGFTQEPYRLAHAAVFGGVEAYYAPFVRVEHGLPRRRDMRDIATPSPSLVPQVIAEDAAQLLLLARAVQSLGHTRIDINMGCPYPMQTRRGRGAGLLSSPDRIAAMLPVISQLHDEGLRFSVKMRIGMLSPDEGLAAIRLLNDAPLEWITIHPRLGQQQYKGTVDMSAFERMLAATRHPVVYNGDLTSVDDILRLEERYPSLRGVMIGRGLLMRPSLSEEYAAGAPLDDALLRSRVVSLHQRVMAAYADRLEGGDHQLLQQMLPFWQYLEPLFPHRALKAINKARSLSDYMAAVRALPLAD